VGSSASAAASRRRDLARRLVLVVEDDDDVRTAVVEAIESEADLQAEGVGNGLAVLGVLARHRPDLVLLDIDMPEMDGTELVEWLRHDPATRAVPLIGMTGLPSRAGLRRDLTRAGCKVILDKPFAIEDLIARIRAALAGVG
jgi:two-component system cell cycle response regulator DivK